MSLFCAFQITAKFETELEEIRKALADTKSENKKMRCQIHQLQNPVNGNSTNGHADSGEPDAKVAKTSRTSSPHDEIEIKQEREDEDKTQTPTTP